MHIPDGYLGPQTYLPAYAAMVAFWSTALARLRQTLRQREVPLLALGAAFSFLIMMFNIPIPGGTSGHAVGAVLIAILLGPWAAVITVSLALIVQALLFADGGITAIGANCFTMAVVMPFTGWWTYRLLSRWLPTASPRHWLAAASAGYVGLNASALATGILFGIQPVLAHDAAGRALYCPFGLGLAVPAMTLEHLLLFGFVEAAVTGWAVAYFRRTAPDLLAGRSTGEAAAPGWTLYRRLIVIFGILLMLTPLGLYLPQVFHANAAWGEWNSTELREETLRTTGQPLQPEGLVRAEQKAWKALFPDYALPGRESAARLAPGMAYFLSGLVGIAVLLVLILFSRRLLTRRQ